MGSFSSPKREWVLTQGAFDKLLTCLDHDRERAAEKYENIRHKLITFFECRGSMFPEEHADETINRAARRLDEGKQIYTTDPTSYFYGVAHNVLKENWGAAQREAPLLEGLSSAEGLSEDPSKLGEHHSQQLELERQLECLEQCLQGIQPRDRKLITRYYEGEVGVKIRNRKLLAEELGIPLNALRIRALRIREKLEDCVENCLKQLPET